MEHLNIAAMSMKGGRNDNFYFSLLEFYPDSGRWFLKSLLTTKDEEGHGDDLIRDWIEDHHVSQLIINFPLSKPACHTCDLDCPGAKDCPVPDVRHVFKMSDILLGEDHSIRESDPKKYENKRNRDDEFEPARDILAKKSSEHLLSRSFKRRIKKGFLPYWNRSVDFWIWNNYYDQLLEIFNCSYDSFGNTSLMLISRFSYLRRHLPNNLELFEANHQLLLIELLRSGILSKKDLQNLFDMELLTDARLAIIRKIEENLNIFIYEHDLEVLVKNVRAFESFLLAVCGQNKQMGQNEHLPSWTLPQETKFVVPKF